MATAPYFHDGSASTIDEVLDHYGRGGRVLEDGANVGDGSRSALKHPLIHGFVLDAAARSDLKAFSRRSATTTCCTTQRSPIQPRRRSSSTRLDGPFDHRPRKNKLNDFARAATPL